MSNLFITFPDNNDDADSSKLPTEVANSRPKSENQEPDTHNGEKISINNASHEPKLDPQDRDYVDLLSKQTIQINEMRRENQQMRQRLDSLEQSPRPIRMQFVEDIRSDVEALQLKVAKLGGTNQVIQGDLDALVQRSRQLEKQRQEERMDDAKRLKVREQQTEARIINNMAGIVRPIVEEILPQRNRRQTYESANRSPSGPASQPMNPPMPSQLKLSRVEVMAGVVPRLVMYGLLATFSCLIIVFLIDQRFVDDMLLPTQQTLSILLSIIILSGGVILFANSKE